MTKETIIEKLKTKYSNLGLSDEIIGSQADFILANSPTEETIDSIVDGVGVVLKSFQSNLDKVRQQKQKDDQKKEENKGQDAGKADDKPSTLEEKLEKLFGMVENMQKQSSVNDKKGNLIKALESKNIPEKFYSKFIGTLDYNENYSEEEAVKAMEADYEDFKQAFAIEGAKGGNPPIGTGGADQKSQVMKDIERLA